MTYEVLNEQQTKQLGNILKKYDLPILDVQISRNTTANNNKIFLVKIGRNKYILRESNETKPLKHLQFETKILQYLHDKNFALTPSIIPNKNGSPITSYNNTYYLLTNFLPGSVSEGVNNLTSFINEKLVNFFESLAKFSRAVQDFSSPIPKNNQSLSYYIKNGKKLFAKLITKVDDLAVKKLLNENRDFIESFITETQRQLELVRFDKAPKQIVHFDFHPGNVNFTGNHVSGIFDFDWVRFDNRITDLACALGQSCYSYRGKERALYNKAKLLTGLTSYRKAYGESEYTIERENEMTQAALRGYMFFQLLWIIEWHIKNPTDKKGFGYIRFSIDVLKLNNFEKLFI